jgi:hypothetical protein
MSQAPNKGHPPTTSLIEADLLNDPLFELLTRAQITALRHMLANYPVKWLIDMAVRSNRTERARAHANPLLKHGAKYFSQNDEDGLLLEICRRIGLTTGRFLEFGVGSGLENNTLILLMSGWRGGWSGGEDLAFEIPSGSRRLRYEKAWITAENAFSICERAAKWLGSDGFDVVGIDLDGNDIHVLTALLDHGVRPSIFIVEYNGKFPPPIRFQIDYDPAHRWIERNDYLGASLQSFVDKLNAANYQLVACNITGVDAFFVDRRFAEHFADIPKGIEDLFMPADYAAVTSSGHPPSPRTVLSILKD